MANIEIGRASLKEKSCQEEDLLSIIYKNYWVSRRNRHPYVMIIVIIPEYFLEI